MPPNNAPIQREMQAVAASSASVAAASSMCPSPHIDVIQTSSRSKNSAVLQLVPISRAECHSLLESKGLSPPLVATEADRNRRCIILTLSRATRDVDRPPLRSNGVAPSPSIHHARKFRDGTVAACVLLGRNEFTGILQSSVSRALCEVSFSRSDSNSSHDASIPVDSPRKTPEACVDDGSSETSKDSAATRFVALLTMRKAPAQHAVHIDGVAVTEPIGRRVPLQDGSILSLWGQTGFAYRVKILCDKEDMSNHAHVRARCRHDESTEQSTCQKRRAESPLSSPNTPKKLTPHQEIRRRGHQLMVGEQTCSLCMDILIRSTFAYPCGHAFCAECTGKCCNTCPTCRGHVQGWMPARPFDTIIWATALQGCLDPEDAKSYLRRRKESGEEEPTIHERECILGKAAKKENGGESGYYLPSPLASSPTPLISTALLPPLFSGAMNPGFHSFSTSWTVNHASYLPNGRSGASAEDAICLDSP